MAEPANGLVEVTGLSKRFGGVQAVHELSFTAVPGRVTGFLGPNGSGKTTTLAMVLGLVRPDAGTATIGGTSYAELDRPARTVGASLSAHFHPAHTGRAHLDIVRRGIGVPESVVADTLELVGMTDAADRKTGGYSLGMRQRLALAAALLGDPQVILLDEPINGLDPEGIRWIRLFLQHLAREGKTVLLSSHLLSEVQQTVDDVVVIRRGELAYAGTLQELQDTSGERAVLVSASDQPGLARALQEAGAEVHGVRGQVMRVAGLDPDAVGRVALAAAIPLSHLSVEESELEQSFLELVEGGAA
ncbi:ATP-binding cassette domain-containing protein [Leucobacter rhizosphaerae]|uniref:ATP-binding cassette domain-containing protein n=1 Tax=Leucobacter rhizosphaerae TaxID=2932245 RepID=A0ABY4FRV8_9MICO|nr:ATP-binding cassette domain-containing protein [Leucobacter rhizosphaerae]UOQ59030.1 ATP-binding cassette domain-containing protein [Leucobacter rhizosphaerae]